MVALRLNVHLSTLSSVNCKRRNVSYVLWGTLFPQPMLDPVILTTIQDVRSVEEKDLKDKVNAVSSPVSWCRERSGAEPGCGRARTPLLFGVSYIQSHLMNLTFPNHKMPFLKHQWLVLRQSIEWMQWSRPFRVSLTWFWWCYNHCGIEGALKDCDIKSLSKLLKAIWTLKFNALEFPTGLFPFPCYLPRN